MPKIEKSITIKAPVEKVFEFFIEPMNLLEVWPSLMEVKDVKKSPDGVVISWRWVYKMAGMRFEGISEITEYIPNRRWGMKTKGGGIESTHLHTFQSEAGGTKMTLDIDFTVPIPLLGKLAEGFIVKLNEQEAESFYANLKARMEA